MGPLALRKGLGICLLCVAGVFLFISVCFVGLARLVAGDA